MAQAETPRLIWGPGGELETAGRHGHRALTVRSELVPGEGSIDVTGWLIGIGVALGVLGVVGLAALIGTLSAKKEEEEEPSEGEPEGQGE